MKKNFIYASIITLSFCSIGMFLLHHGIIGYGISFFVFLPFVIGYILGNSILKKGSLYGLIFSLLVFMLLLFFGELEGMICLLMSLIIILVPLALGLLIRMIVNRFRSKKQNDRLMTMTTPLLLFLIMGITESKVRNDKKEIIEVSSEIILPYSTINVYNAIKSVDTLDAKKPFLMQLDLPIPYKCILEKEEVGGYRTCYFEGGKIVEKITEIEPGIILKMDVVSYELTGRKWLGFKEAIYLFEKTNNGSTKMTRKTTYTSELYPRFYWKPLEKIGIEQEHQYVFNNLVKDLENNH